MQRKGGHRSATVGFVAAALLALPLVGAQAPLADAAKGGKKIRVCVAKKGPDKGTMRFAKKGKCKRGERKLAWNKKGKAGAQGTPGAAGPQGPAGSVAGLDDILDRLSALESQVAGLDAALGTLSAQLADLDTALDSEIDRLESDLAAVAAQIPGLQQNIGELCTQAAALTDQSNAVTTFLGPLNTFIETLPLAPDLDVPAALEAFGCSTT